MELQVWVWESFATKHVGFTILEFYDECFQTIVKEGWEPAVPPLGLCIVMSGLLVRVFVCLYVYLLI